METHSPTYTRAPGEIPKVRETAHRIARLLLQEIHPPRLLHRVYLQEDEHV
jgi:hypothetical protein